MLNVALDGFVLRFPRTGIVNYVFNIALEIKKRPGFQATILLEDMNFSDPEIAQFVTSENTRIVSEIEYSGLSKSIRDRFRDKKLMARLPSPAEVNQSVLPGEIYHATDWYHYPGKRARANIITCFDLTTKLYPQFHEYTNITKDARKSKALRNFDHIVAISESTRQDIISHYDVRPERISTSHLGVDYIYESSVRIDRESLLSKYNIGVTRKYILSVCTIEPRKNIIGILNAYKRLRELSPSYEDIQLVLSGHMGWRNEGLNEFLATYPYRKDIVFAGYVALTDMPSLYYHSEAFVYLSFYEGFGIPILEAMKSGCPVVCSNTSSMPEVLGTCGALVSPDSPEEAASAIARILDDSSYANSLRFAGMQRSKAFSWGRHVDDLTRIYTEA